MASWANRRRIPLIVLAFLFGAGALGALFGIGIVIGWSDHDSGGIHRVHDIGFGILYGIVVAGAFFAMMRRPATKPSVFLQVVAAAVAVAIASLISADPDYLIIAAVVALAAAILLALHPAREEVLRPKTRVSVPMSAFAVIGAVPLVWFGLTAARLQRNGSALDPHVKMDHWATMASMAFGLVLVGLLSSARIRGWRFTAWCAGLGAAVYGLASIVFHRFPGTDVSYAGSEGIGWALVALVGGVAFVAVAEWEAGRSFTAGSTNSSAG
jgi:hypothetical protein